MLKRSLLRNLVILCAAASLGLAYLLLNTQIVETVLSKPFYAYSILPFLVSCVFVSVIVSKRGFYSPSLFLLLFFLAVPLLGSVNARQYFDHVGSYFGRKLPSFDFPTFLWSVGTASFFGGVLLGWRLLPKSKRNALVVSWDHRRAVLLLSFSLVLAIVGTMLALYRIGYVPVLRFDVTDVRADYFKTVGSLASRFSQHWPVPGLLSSMLFFLERGKKKYMYLSITIICALGAMFYAQRTGLVWILSAFGLMYLKFSRPKRLRLLAAAGIAFVLVYGLMIQAEYRSGLYASDSENRIVKHAFFEWSQYSIVVNEARSGSKYLGWKIFVGPFFTFVPRQIYTLLGQDEQDKGTLMKEYSAAYYYGKEFDEPYGIRITPIGEAFAAYGFCGVILQMLGLGLAFGGLERAYFSLDKRDARLCLVCYGLSLMTHMPITTMWVLLVPLTVTGVFVVAYYLFGTRKCSLSEPKTGLHYSPVGSVLSEQRRSVRLSGPAGRNTRA
jgi:oligosaccharide repeat unit polymerase